MSLVCNEDCLNCIHDDCIWELKKTYYQKNKEKMKAYSREYYQKNKEKILAYHKEYNKTHKRFISEEKHQKMLEYYKNYYQKKRKSK